jgi:hypothetical protein
LVDPNPRPDLPLDWTRGSLKDWNFEERGLKLQSSISRVKSVLECDV